MNRLKLKMKLSEAIENKSLALAVLTLQECKTYSTAYDREKISKYILKAYKVRGKVR